MAENEKSLMLVTYEYPPYVIGGVAIYSHQLAEWLSTRGWTVYVITGRAGLREGVTVQRRGRIVAIRIYFPDISPRLVFYAKLAKRHIAKLIQRGISLVLSNSPLTGLLPVLSDTTTFTVYHMSSYSVLPFFQNFWHALKTVKPGELPLYMGYPALETWIRRDLLYSSFNIFIARHVKSEVEWLYPDLAPKISRSSVVAYPGIEYNQLSLLKEHNRRTEKTKTVVAFVGRLYFTKGITYAVEAVRSLVEMGERHIEFWVFGTGPLQKWLIKQSKAIPIRYFGFVERSRLLSLLAKYVDVLLHPSLYEGAPLAVMEAQALGIPTVAFDLPWSTEFIMNGINGYRAPYPDVHRLGEVVLKAKELDRDKVALLAKRFDREVSFRVIESLLEEGSHR
jgi:glycosyltransferase involved in cell wall biosynthesis